MNTMSECQVEAVRGSEKSMMEQLESMKEGGTGGRQDRVCAVGESKRDEYREVDGWREREYREA